MAQRSRLAAWFRATLVGGGVTLVHCSSSPSSGLAVDAGADAADCYPDSDGINGGQYTFDLTVDDTGFSKTILATQNNAQVVLKLTNTGKKHHGFQVECTNVASAYPNLPAGCSADSCFPANSVIPPLAPGASATITFDTPTPDGFIYPFKSSEPADSDVPGLNDGQWSMM